jgi:hypothetical protein
MPTQARIEMARRAGAALERARTIPAFVGFDGFIDLIYDVADQRRDPSPTGYTRLATIQAFAARAASAAGKSANIEMVLRETRAGGNGPLMAGGLAGLGARVTYVGAIGEVAVNGPQGASWSVHPVYEAFSRICERVVPIGRPGSTDALEFDDGKLMLNHPEAVQEVTWDRLLDVVGRERLIELVRQSRFIGLVTWSLMGGVAGIWRGLIDQVFPAIAGDGIFRRVFVDLADPTRRPDGDLRVVIGLLREMDATVPVTLGLNLAEGERVAGVLGVPASVDYDPGRDVRNLDSLGERVRALAADVRERAGLSCVVVHPREGAAGAARDDAGRVRSAWFEGPFVRRPKLSTGAGDHFNAGFGFAQAAGMGLEECLAIGVATSGAYVRDGGSAPRSRVVDLLQTLPGAE